MRTSHFARIALIAALALLPSRTVKAQQAIGSGTVESGTLSFDGHATLGDFTGTTTTITGEFTGGADLAAVRGWVEAPVNTLVTGNGKRDTDLNKSMESDKYPTIRFDLEGVTAHAVHGDTTDVTLSGQFTIHGVKRSVDLQGRVIMAGERIRVLADTPMNLKDYQIGGLSKMLGMLKMSEHIEVHIEVVFKTAGDRR
jgi:polyisoprenoid-binding protein YceI